MSASAGSAMAGVEIFDERVCALGEGAFWHPQRGQFFWFDVLGRKLLTRGDEGSREWRFDGCVSAAGWIDRDTLLIAGETALFAHSLHTGAATLVCPLEAGNAATRSNDGRADPWGGFWIGTMGKRAERDAGAIYRYFRGELRRLFAPLTIPNAIGFAPDRRHAYFADTARHTVWRQALAERDGWPQGEPQVFIDGSAAALCPDGAAVDSDGHFWNAQWGAGRVARYDAAGHFVEAVALPATQTTCPAFGGDDLTTLFVTTATQDLAAPPAPAGKTFAIATQTRGQAEHRILL